MMKREQALCKKPEIITEVVLSDDSYGFEVPIVNHDEAKDILNTTTGNDADRSIQHNDEMEIVCNNQRVADKTNKNIADYTIGNKDSTVIENAPTCLTQRHAGKKNTSINKIAFTKKKIATKNSSNNNVEEEINVVDLSDDELVNGQLNSSNAQKNDIHKPLLEPHKVQDEVPIEVRIQAIEKQMGLLHTHVVKLEKEEIPEDSVVSPFIICERYKVKIVELYSVLCSLVNAEPVKRHEVRFTAVDERLRLPLKNLEEFINANIGSDGLPYFPDFNEVVECVKAANISEDLGLSKQKVLEDARILFTYCGRALQESRQRREWRHLLRHVGGAPLRDPADADPALLAKLQANRRHALNRETELTHRYLEMAPLHLAEFEVVNNTDKEDIADVEVEVPLKPAPKKKRRIAPISCDKFGMVPRDGFKILNTDDVPLTPAPKKRRRIAPISCDKFGMVPRDGFTIVKTLNRENDDSGQNKNKTNFEVDKTVHDTEVDTPENQLSTIDRNHTSDVHQNETIASHEDIVIESTNFFACSIPLLNLSATGYLLSVQEQVIEDVIHKALADCNTVTDDSTNQCHTIQSDSMIKNEKDCQEITSFSGNNVFEGGKAIQIYDTKITDNTFGGTPVIKKEPINEVDIEEEHSETHIHSTSRSKDVNLNISKVVLPTLTILPDSKKAGSLNDPKNYLVSANTSECKTGTRIVNEEHNTAKIPGLSYLFNSNHINVDNTNLNTSLVPSDLSNCDFSTDIIEPLIKEEPCIDIQPQLEELGDNFTTTVIEIQDPFLVIEISSDSSDDEMDSFYY